MQRKKRRRCQYTGRHQVLADWVLVDLANQHSVSAVPMMLVTA
jgi:hypothetical protein